MPEQNNTKQIQSSQLSLPKGGGAIQRIGETVQANEFSGTASRSIPIFASVCRNLALLLLIWMLGGMKPRLVAEQDKKASLISFEKWVNKTLERLGELAFEKNRVYIEDEAEYIRKEAYSIYEKHIPSGAQPLTKIEQTAFLQTMQKNVNKYNLFMVLYENYENKDELAWFTKRNKEKKGETNVRLTLSFKAPKAGEIHAKSAKLLASDNELNNYIESVKFMAPAQLRTDSAVFYLDITDQTKKDDIIMAVAKQLDAMIPEDDRYDHVPYAMQPLPFKGMATSERHPERSSHGMARASAVVDVVVSVIDKEGIIHDAQKMQQACRDALSKHKFDPQDPSKVIA